MLMVFQNHAHIQDLQKLPTECIRTEMYKFAISHQELPFIFGNRRSFVIMAPTSLDNVAEFSADVLHMLHFV